jgi:hypothetical protein
MACRAASLVRDGHESLFRRGTSDDAQVAGVAWRWRVWRPAMIVPLDCRWHNRTLASYFTTHTCHKDLRPQLTTQSGTPESQHAIFTATDERPP